MAEVRIYFASDYMEGAHPAVMAKLMETNLLKTEGYGLDRFCDRAKELIRAACGCEKAQVEFLVGGTQANATVIDAALPRYAGVIAPASGHINAHEAGAVESGGHKILPLPHELGKITASQIERCAADWKNDANRDHMIMPGMVYLSQPTEYGTLYSLAELEAISEVCRRYGILLFVDGARLAYALASPKNDVTLPDLARLCDVFYIGGTKCGALFGEAVVIPSGNLIPHFFTTIKQHGALLAKGRLLGVQFGALFENGLYFELGKNAVDLAGKLKSGLKKLGYELLFDTPTNQVFVITDDVAMKRLAQKIEFAFFDKYDETRSIIRFCTGWATTEADVDALLAACGPV